MRRQKSKEAEQQTRSQSSVEFMPTSLSSSHQASNEFETTLKQQEPEQQQEPLVSQENTSNSNQNSISNSNESNSAAPFTSASSSISPLDDMSEDDDHDELMDFNGPSDKPSSASQMGGVSEESTSVEINRQQQQQQNNKSQFNSSSANNQQQKRNELDHQQSQQAIPKSGAALKQMPLETARELLLGPFKSESEAPATITLSGVVYQKLGASSSILHTPSKLAARLLDQMNGADRDNLSASGSLQSSSATAASGSAPLSVHSFTEGGLQSSKHQNNIELSLAALRNTQDENVLGSTGGGGGDKYWPLGSSSTIYKQAASQQQQQSSTTSAGSATSNSEGPQMGSINEILLGPMKANSQMSLLEAAAAAANLPRSQKHESSTAAASSPASSSIFSSFHPPTEAAYFGLTDSLRLGPFPLNPSSLFSGLSFNGANNNAYALAAAAAVLADNEETNQALAKTLKYKGFVGSSNGSGGGGGGGTSGTNLGLNSNSLDGLSSHQAASSGNSATNPMSVSASSINQDHASLWTGNTIGGGVVGAGGNIVGKKGLEKYYLDSLASSASDNTHHTMKHKDKGPIVIVQKDVKPVKYHLMRAYLKLRRLLRPFEATYVFVNDRHSFMKRSRQHARRAGPSKQPLVEGDKAAFNLAQVGGVGGIRLQHRSRPASLLHLSALNKRNQPQTNKQRAE